MTEHFDAIIVGSGFGGSVTAYRLAEAGKNVCLLERGKPYPPQSFARSPAEMSKNFWDPSEGLHGLFDVWSFHKTDAVVSSGLGGGSLIYANVLLRKPEKWFVQEDLTSGYEYWPVTRADLDPHYDRVEAMLDGQCYPAKIPPYSNTPKMLALREAAMKSGYGWSTPKLAISFASGGKPPAPGLPIIEEFPNLHDVPRTTCKLCGECDIGCTTGSKNTLDYTYLSQAKRLGADIRTRSEVRSFKPLIEGGFEVEYVEHLPENEGKKTDTSKLPVQRLTADKLILAAGTYGTSYLMLRNKSNFPKISPHLGSRVSLNGDFLAFAWKCEDEHGNPKNLEPTRGPVVTSAVYIPDTVEGGDSPGFYVQDAGFPAFLSWIARPLDGMRGITQIVGFLWHYISSLFKSKPNPSLSDALANLIGPSEATGSSLVFLGMGRDVPDGVLSLDNKGKWLEFDYSIDRSRKLYQALRETTSKMSKILGGSYKENPLFTMGRPTTVHPLGGCPMGRSVEDGVVDSYGEVFNYPGLYVVDGAMMPGPAGSNPSLTIAALADRFADRMIETWR